MSDKTIHFIITGGTIDSFYDGTKDTVIPSKKSFIPRFVRSLKLYNKQKFTTICMKDSRNIVETDLKKILNAVEKTPHRKISQ